MLTFNYRARNAKTGELVRAKVEADNEQAAARLIRDQGLTPINIKEVRKSFGSIGKITTKDKVIFARQLSTLINASLPLDQAMQTVMLQTPNRGLQNVIHGIIVDVESGRSLSEAMDKYPKVFNKVFVSLVAAGEKSGTLDTALERLAYQQEKDSDIASKIRSAMIYPLIILVVMVAVLVFMLLKVLPQVDSIYSSMPTAHLPAITQTLLDISNFIRSDWYVLLIAVVIVIFGTRVGLSTDVGRRFKDTLYLKMPVLNRLMMKMYMARFARTGSTLISSGIPMLQMLEITGNAMENIHLREDIRRIISQVKGGKSLGDAIEGDPNFLELVPNMIKVGEQSGNIDTMLGKAADYYEKELDTEIKNIQTTIEPVMMVIVGIMAFIIVAAVLLPIYGLANQSSLTGQ